MGGRGEVGCAGAFLGCGGGFLGGWEGWGRGGEKVRRGEAGGMRFLGAAVAVRFWWCVVGGCSVLVYGRRRGR